MNDTTTLDAAPGQAFSRPDVTSDRPCRPARRRFLFRALSALLGWAWRLAVGALCGMNYFTSVLVVGWLYRWTQGRVLYGWWKQSRVSACGSFADFCATLGPDAPVSRPRWLLRERFNREHIRAEVYAPTADGEPPWWPRRLARLAVAPLRSLWLNLKLGVLGVTATFLITGLGCLLMTFSWYYGWLNSFHKGYEEALVGPLTGIAGILLFALALLYVPMAQIHQAVTGDFRAFFEFRFVWRLVRARLTVYLLLAALITGLAILLEILKTVPAGWDDQLDYFTSMSDAELLQFFWRYYLGCSAFLVVCLLATHLLAAAIYRSAVLKVLHRGRVSREQLHPVLADWLDRLALLPAVPSVPGGLWRMVRVTGRLGYRRLLFPAIFLVWVLFTLRTYVGEFLNYHHAAGFLNHPMVQLPCFNYIPNHLEESAKNGGTE